MSYSTLMVHLDLNGSNEVRLQIVGELAEHFNSRLIGIAAADIQPLYFMDGVEAQNFLEKDRSRLKTQMADCEAQFRRILNARADNMEWRSALDWPTDFVARNARSADLIITGSQTVRPDATRQINSGDLVLRAGRPVLVVPSAAEFLRLNSVVIAWKDTREATLLRRRPRASPAPRMPAQSLPRQTSYFWERLSRCDIEHSDVQRDRLPPRLKPRRRADIQTSAIPEGRRPGA